MLKVAFLGLGSIGRPMARKIKEAGFPITVWNRTPDRVSAFAKELGLTLSKSAADAVKDADVVAICLSTSLDVESVLNSGAMAAIKAGATVLDLTSGDPATSKRIAAALAAKRVAFIDAPVSGGVKGAEAGTL